ncbi:helix-turn-helix domain-containing protein [Streptomyces youssoufiensis]
MELLVGSSGLLNSAVLDRDDVRRALAEHDFAVAFALIKKWGGLSQNRIAAACQMSPGKVSLIMSGQQQVTSFEVIRRIADGLGIPGRLLGLAKRPWEENRRAPTLNLPEQPSTWPVGEVPWRSEAAVVVADRLTRSDLMMDRRAVTRAMSAAAVGGAALLDPLEGWLQPAVAAVDARRNRGGRLGDQEVLELEATTRVFRAWDHKYGGGLRRKAVLGQLNEVAAHLADGQVSSIERRLYQVMAQLAGTAATMAWDSGLQGRAQEYYRLALHSAHAGGDRAFGVNVLAGMARQMLYCRRPGDALELVRIAQQGARFEVGPRVLAMLYSREAWAYAAMGRCRAFQRSMTQAAETLAGADPSKEPYWIAYFDEAELAGVTGGRLLDLARQDPVMHAEAAAESIQQALEARGAGAGRSFALDTIGLAECRFLMGDVTGAVTATHRAADAAARTQSGRVRERLGALYPYTVGQSASQPLREVRNRLRELLSN